MSVSSVKSSPAPPTPFKITDSTQLDDWKKWQRSFRYYANAVNLDQKSHDFQLSTFKSLIGPDGLEIYNTFSILDITDVESVIRKFDDHFKPKVNLTLERYKLYKLNQKSGQRFDDFLSDITNQVDKCEFLSMRDEIVLYKIVGGIENDEVRDVLLADADLKYDKAVQICRASTAMHFLSGKENVSKGNAIPLGSKGTEKKKEELGKIPNVSNKDLRRSVLESTKKEQEDDFEVKMKNSKVVKKRGGIKKVSKKGLKENVMLKRSTRVRKVKKGRNSFEISLAETVSLEKSSSFNESTDDIDVITLEGNETTEIKKPSDVVENVSGENSLELPKTDENDDRGQNVGGDSDGGHSDWGDDFHNDDNDDDADKDPDFVVDVETAVGIVMKRQSSKKEEHPMKEESKGVDEEPPKAKHWTCEECGKEFTSKYGLERHRGIHTGAYLETGNCFYCRKEFKKRYLRRHMVKSHPDAIGAAGPKVYSCDKCDFKTTFKTNIRRHQYQHTDEKPLACELCEYKCITPRLMRAHVAKLHTGIRPYPCPVCNRGFLQRDAMKRHMVTHLTPDEKALHLLRIADSTTCETCGKVFSTRGALKTHSIVHTGEKPYACNVCDYRSVNKSGLSSHMMKHSEEKPFVCTVCGYSCKLKQTLQGHMNTHTGDRPYPCKLCDSKFKQYPHLKRHMLTHTGEKPYVCDICGHRWTTQSNLKQHMKVHLNQSGDPSLYTPPRKRQKKPKIVLPANQSELQPPPTTCAPHPPPPPPPPPLPTNAIPQWSEQVSTINPIECFPSLETPPPFHPTYPVHQGNPRPPDCRYFQQRQWPNPN